MAINFGKISRNINKAFDKKVQKATAINLKYLGLGLVKGIGITVAAGVTSNYLQDMGWKKGPSVIGGLGAAFATGMVLDHVINDQIDEDVSTYQFYKDMQEDIDQTFEEIRETKRDTDAERQLARTQRAVNEALEEMDDHIQDLQATLGILREDIEMTENEAVEEAAKEITLEEAAHITYQMALLDEDFARVYTEVMELPEDLLKLCPTEEEFIEYVKAKHAESDEPSALEVIEQATEEDPSDE